MIDPADKKGVLLLEIARLLLASKAPIVGRGALAEIDAVIARANPKMTPAHSAQLRVTRADMRLRWGDIDGAIADLGVAREIATTQGDKRALTSALHDLALAWMRLGERNNCVRGHNQDSCIFPLRGGAIHADRKGSQEAAKILRELLELEPGDFASMWLLNVAHMTLGTWPEGVPPVFRISPDALKSEREMPRMHDIAPKLGLNSFTCAGASIMDDFDGDGRLDVLVSSMDPMEPLRLFLQRSDQRFVNVAKEAGLSGQLGGLQVIHFDANNDGRLDLLVQRGAWLHDAGRIPNSLLIQRPDGTFVDRTRESGIEIAAPSQVAAVADIDLDGDLDLFLGYESERLRVPPAYPSRLFRNRGDGTFEDITTASGVHATAYCKGAAFGDYDGDRYPDLYVANLGGANRLFHNRRDGTFEDVAIELGVSDPIDAFACWFFDYNNDGRLDLYAAGYSQAWDRTAAMCAWYRNHTNGVEVNRLYENDGRGGFVDATWQRSLARTMFPMGANFGDVDNDGWLDLYLATGDPDFSSLWPNIMLRNDGGRRFEDVTAATGTGHLQKGHGVSFGDIDGDGDQDLFVQTGGAFKDDAFADVLFENPGHGHHWLTVRLVGKRTNRFGVGCRVRATIEDLGEEPGSGPTGVRDVYGFVGANSSFGGNSLQQELGLGDATRIVALEVFWPVTNTTQRFETVPLDQVIMIREDDPTLTVVQPVSGRS